MMQKEVLGYSSAQVEFIKSFCIAMLDCEKECSTRPCKLVDFLNILNFYFFGGHSVLVFFFFHFST